MASWTGDHHVADATRVDAVIMRIGERSEAVLKRCEGVPRVVISNRPGVMNANLCWGNASLGLLAAEHLLEQGHRSLAMVYEAGRAYHLNRLEGFEAVASEAGYEVRRINVDDEGRLRRALATLPGPTGVLAATDIIARNVLLMAAENGQRVPEDLAIMGIGGDEIFCETTPPSLTSVVLPGEELGYQAAAMLERHLAGEPFPDAPVEVTGRYVAVRRSTDVIAIDDPLVVRALKMIRDSRRDGVTVSDIHEAIPASRRSLELRFRKAVGRSIGEEIERVRIEWAKQLLRDTNWSIEKVAASAHFPGAPQMWRIFKWVTGLSPTAYRDVRFGRG